MPDTDSRRADALAAAPAPTAAAMGDAAGYPTVPAAAAEPPLPAAAPVLTDAMAERLLRDLEGMDDDYARTLAAERPEAEITGATATASEEVQGAAAAGNLTEASDGHPAIGTAADMDEDDGSDGGGEGYAMLGSDPEDGGSDGPGNADSDDEPREAPIAKPPAAPEPWPQPDSEAASGWPAPPAAADEEDSDFENFQGGGALERFADFGASNPALPAPPPGMSQFEATPLTDDAVNCIKEAMSQMNLTPPPWARDVPDHKLQRMVKSALRA